MQFVPLTPTHPSLSLPALIQVTTTGGAAVITMDRGQASGLVQHANGTVWNVTKDYKSGFFSSWNKVGEMGGWSVGVSLGPGCGMKAR